MIFLSFLRKNQSNKTSTTTQYNLLTLQPMVQRIIDNFLEELPVGDLANLHLKICLEPCAIVFLLQSANNHLRAAEYFAWSKTDAEAPAEIANILKQNSKLFNFNQARTTVYFRTENAMFAPAELIADIRLLVQVQFGFKAEEGCLQKKITDEIIAAWKINSVWAELLTDQFPGHVSQSSLGNLYLSVQPNVQDTIYLAFGNGLVELVAIFEQNLQLAKCFAYSSIDDIHYHLLNICKQLKVSADKIQVKIQGFIEKDASLYRSLQTFFEDVQTINADNRNWPEMLKALPAHYFTGLIQGK